MNRHLATDEHERMDRSDASRSPRLGRRLGIELLMMGGVFAIYRQIRFLTRNDTDAAMDNARRVVDFEKQFHFFSERTVQDLVMHSHTFVAFLNRYYVTVHFPLTVAFLLWGSSASQRLRADPEHLHQRHRRRPGDPCRVPAGAATHAP